MNIRQVKRDIGEAIKIMNNGVIRSNNDGRVTHFKKYDSVYPYNNENINDYYSYFNYSGNVLSVASSGDHMLHAILAGSDDITLFDINILLIGFLPFEVATPSTSHIFISGFSTRCPSL